MTLLLHWKNNVQVIINYNLTSDGGPAKDGATKNKIFVHCVLQLIWLGDQIFLSSVLLVALSTIKNSINYYNY